MGMFRDTFFALQQNTNLRNKLFGVQKNAEMCAKQWKKMQAFEHFFG